LLKLRADNVLYNKLNDKIEEEEEEKEDDDESLCTILFHLCVLYIEV